MMAKEILKYFVNSLTSKLKLTQRTLMNIKIVTNKEEVFILLCTDGCCLSCLLNYGSRIPCVWSHPSYTIWEVCVLCELQSVNVHALDYELNFFLNAYISYLY